MKLDDAIAAHSAWKLRLRQFVDGRGDKLDSKVVGRDDACPLGQWLHGDGRAHATRPEFERLVKEHAQFHKTAGDVVRAVEMGSKARAEALLASRGAFDLSSQATVDAILGLKRVAK